MKRARYLPTAVRDLDEIAEGISNHNLEAAIRFCHAVETDIDRVANFPGLGTRREFRDPTLTELRSWPIKGYRGYLIFYLPADYGIDVVRIVHGARNLEALSPDHSFSTRFGSATHTFFERANRKKPAALPRVFPFSECRQ